jgi:hypothetical protein
LDEVMPVYPNLGEALAANLSPESGLPQ